MLPQPPKPRSGPPPTATHSRNPQNLDRVPHPLQPITETPKTQIGSPTHRRNPRNSADLRVETKRERAEQRERERKKKKKGEWGEDRIKRIKKFIQVATVSSIFRGYCSNV